MRRRILVRGSGMSSLALRLIVRVCAACLPALVAACMIDELLNPPKERNREEPEEASGAARPTRLVINRQPSNSLAGTVIAPAVEVAVLDQYGAPATDFGGPVTMTLSSNPGGATLSGVRTRNAENGVATFNSLTIDRPGVGYRLAASANGLTGATSAAFDVASRPILLRMALRGGNGQSDTVAATLAQPYVVRVTDDSNRPVAGVTVSWTVQQGGGAVLPASSSTDAGGEARTTHTFGTTAGPQVVSAAVIGTTDVQASFTSTARHGEAARFTFTSQPSDTRAGATITPAVEVTVEDRFGNTAISFSGVIAAHITPLTGTPLAALSGTLNRTPTAGVASFDNLSIDLPGLGYRLRMAGMAGAALAADSRPFNVTL